MQIISSNKKFFILSLFFIFLLAFTACKSKQETVRQIPPPVVGIGIVEQKDVPIENMYVGIVEGSKAVDVRAQVGGILRERVYQEGQFVKAGDVLFIIESETYEAALKAAKGNLAAANAQYRQAKLNYDRYSALYKTNSISKRDYDAAVAAYEAAKAQVEAAQGTLNDSSIRLGYTKVVAPVSGYTSKANFTVGNLISTSTTLPLTVINQVDPIYVNFSVPASFVTNLRLLAAEDKIIRANELTSNIYTADNVKYPETGKIIFFDNLIVASTGDIRAKAEFRNLDMALLPGQYVRATLDGFTLKNAITIPQKSIIFKQSGPQVIVVDQNNIAHFTNIKLGMNLGNIYIVEEGLKSGDRIVVEGSNKVMRDNSPVMDQMMLMKMIQQQQQQAQPQQQQQQAQPQQQAK